MTRNGRLTPFILTACWLAIVYPAGTTAAQALPGLGDGPTAQWIAAPEVAGDAYGVFHFRKTLDLPAVPERFVVHVSADNRYRLYVNGQSVSTGPQRSDLMHWRYETVDLAPYLQAGSNVLAALVWNWGAYRPVAQHSHRTGFLLQGDGEAEAVAGTGGGWKVYVNPGYAPVPVDGASVGGYYASPPGESVSGDRYPWGWRESGFDDSAWTAVEAVDGAVVGQTRGRGTHPYGEAGGWQLEPRTLPPMEETPIRFATIRRSTGLTVDDAFLNGEYDLVVPAQTQAVVLLDQAHLTNAYLNLELSGGAGGTVTLTYAESLKDADGRKGNRDEIEGKTISGIQDIFLPDGGPRRPFETLWFRTYRYVRIEVETAEDPLLIHDIHGRFTAYPFEERARFESDQPWLTEMWDMNWRGARLCAWETYFDTPYYEQLQYVGDTRIQALISLYMSGDDRLVRQAISHFDRSRIPEGITMSRYPSDLGQFIPPFSLLYVAMVHDYWMHRDDPAYVGALLPGIRGILAWFEGYLDDTGMLGPLPWWSYADWAPEWPAGRPPGADNGHSALLTLQFVYALQRAADLEEHLGVQGMADRYREVAGRVVEATRSRAWNDERGLFLDAPEASAYSQQTNVMAILVDAVPSEEKPVVMERLLADSSITQATYYFGYYLFEALFESGLGDRYIDLLTPWQGMLALGLTTTPETPDPTRSDSHAWAAHPNYGLLATVLGIRPAESGFKSVRIAPDLGSLTRAEGRVPHPLGDIDVRLERSGSGVQGQITLPPGLNGVFEWGGQQLDLSPGPQDISIDASE